MGRVPLLYAVLEAGDARVVRRLVLAGADPAQPHATGATPRQLAATIANADTSEYVDSAGLGA